jgi:hypothetical protein
MVGPGASRRYATTAPVPVLGNAFADSHGFGHAHPVLLSSGPSATVTVQHLRWTHCAKEATGLGRHANPACI